MKHKKSVLILLSDAFANLLQLVSALTEMGVIERLDYIVAFTPLRSEFRSYVEKFDAHDPPIGYCLRRYPESMLYTLTSGVTRSLGSTRVIIIDFDISHPSGTLARLIESLECMCNEGYQVTIAIEYHDYFDEYIHLLQRLAALIWRARLSCKPRIVTIRGLTIHEIFANEAIELLKTASGIEVKAYNILEAGAAFYETFIPFPDAKRVWIEACLPNTLEALLWFLEEWVPTLLAEMSKQDNNGGNSGGITLELSNPAGGSIGVLAAWLYPCTRIVPSGLMQRSFAHIELVREEKTVSSTAKFYARAFMLSHSEEQYAMRIRVKNLVGREQRGAYVPFMSTLCRLCAQVNRNEMPMRPSPAQTRWLASIRSCMTDVASQNPPLLVQLLQAFTQKQKNGQGKRSNLPWKLSYLYAFRCIPIREGSLLVPRLHVIAAVDITKEAGRRSLPWPTVNRLHIDIAEGDYSEEMIKRLENLLKTVMPSYKYLKHSHPPSGLGYHTLAYVSPYTPCDNIYCAVGRLYGIYQTPLWGEGALFFTNSDSIALTCEDEKLINTIAKLIEPTLLGLAKLSPRIADTVVNEVAKAIIENKHCKIELVVYNNTQHVVENITMSLETLLRSLSLNQHLAGNEESLNIAAKEFAARLLQRALRMVELDKNIEKGMVARNAVVSVVSELLPLAWQLVEDP